MYAVIETGGKQYRVELGSEIEIDRLEAAPGETIELGRVLLLADGDEAQVGRPTVDGASVSASVVRQDRGDKIVVFKYRPKARRRVKRGHRQDLTVVRVSDIVVNGRSAAKEAEAQATEAEAQRQAAEQEAERKAAADKALAEKLERERKAAEEEASAAEGQEAAKPVRRRRKAGDAEAGDAPAEQAAGAGAAEPKAQAKSSGRRLRSAKASEDQAAGTKTEKTKAEPKRSRTKKKE